MNSTFRNALGPGKDCPAVETLARLLSAAPPAELTKHVAGCAHCQTEVHLMQTFEAAEVSAADAAAVDQIVQRLQNTSSLPRPAKRESWWREFLATPWLRPAALTFAGLLVVSGIVLQFRQGAPPELRTSLAGSEDVMRSNDIQVLTPLGDLKTAPAQIAWKAVAGAAKYEVRLLEVDRTELWKSEIGEASIAVPEAVQQQIVPAKTLMFQVRAMDAAGRTVAQSDMLRLRLLQNIYGH